MKILLIWPCGGRISEILSYGNFTESKTDGYVVQKGILKQRGPARREEVVKPIIHYTRLQFFELLGKLREKLKPKIDDIKKGNYTHYELSQDFNNKINNRVKSLFGEALHSHDLRKIYANRSPIKQRQVRVAGLVTSLAIHLIALQ